VKPSCARRFHAGAHDADVSGSSPGPARPPRSRLDTSEAQPTSARFPRIELGSDASPAQRSMKTSRPPGPGHGGSDAIERASAPGAMRSACPVDAEMPRSRAQGPDTAEGRREDITAQPSQRSSAAARGRGRPPTAPASMIRSWPPARNLSRYRSPEAIEIAWGASEHRRQRMRSGLSGQQRACTDARSPRPDEPTRSSAARPPEPASAAHRTFGEPIVAWPARIEIANRWRGSCRH